MFGRFSALYVPEQVYFRFSAVFDAQAVKTGRVLCRSYCEKGNEQPEASGKPAQQPAGGPEQVYFRFSAVFDAQGSKNR